MKFPVATLASMIAVFPLFAQQASAMAVPSVVARQAGGALTSTTLTTNATANNPDPQNSLTLDPSVIATGFEQNGQAVQEAGQVASLTSSNNFINFCATQPGLPITNGLQIKTGSCNPAPMGVIAGVANMPSAAFVNPPNFGTIPADQSFDIVMNINNLETGNFVNAETNYFAAPQQLNSAGQIIGHSHVVVEAISSFNSTEPTNPNVFAFFKGLNSAAVNGQLTATVAAGLPAGIYRVSSINTAANHQPALVSVAQHGALDCQHYFTVSGGANANNATAEAAAADQGSVANAQAAAAAAASSSAAAAAGATDAASASVAASSAVSTDAASSSVDAASAAVSASADASSVAVSASVDASSAVVSASAVSSAAAGANTAISKGGFGGGFGNGRGGFGGFGGKGKKGKGRGRRFAREY